MNKYEKSKIYKIESLTSDKIYIGTTSNDYMSSRMAKHRNSYKRYKANNEREHQLGRVYVYDIFDESGVENCFITLIENFKCNDVNELRTREAHYIKSLNCVNKYMPGRTMEEYSIDNAEEIKLSKKNRYIRDKVKEFHCDCGATLSFYNKSRHINVSCKLKK